MAARRSMTPRSLDEVAVQAEVDRGFVERLHALGAIGRDEAQAFTEIDIRRVRLLRAWAMRVCLPNG